MRRFNARLNAWCIAHRLAYAFSHSVSVATLFGLFMTFDGRARDPWLYEVTVPAILITQWPFAYFYVYGELKRRTDSANKTVSGS